MSELLTILVIVMLLFGTKRLKTLGGDLGGAIHGFRKAMEGEERNEPATRPMIAAASRAMKSMGSKITCVVPSR